MDFYPRQENFKLRGSKILAVREVELEIVAFDRRGAGVGRVGKRRYRVDYAYPGDRVLAVWQGEG